ncbi:MAG: DEAD/DEAH box helicase [Bacteroidales bacterium]|nr:DEAD/DEAH box helicase [Bacteroidales bacterium]
MKFSVLPDFLVYIFPDIQISRALWRALPDSLSTQASMLYFDYEYRKEFKIRMFRNCLYALLYEQEKYRERESELASNVCPQLLEAYYFVLFNSRYDEVIKLISTELVCSVVKYAIDRASQTLTPASELLEQMQRIGNNWPKCDEIVVQLQIWNAYMQGDFGTAIKLAGTDENGRFAASACQLLLEGQVTESMKMFGQYLKYQSVGGMKTPIPIPTFLTYFYLIALRLSDAKVTIPACRKIVTWLLKSEKPGFYNPFAAIVFDTINEQQDETDSIIRRIKASFAHGNISVYSCFNILIYYILNKEAGRENYQHIYDIVRKNADAGYILPAFEAAFVMTRWFDDKECTELYKSLAKQQKYQPLISRITFQGEWEKSLNLLLGLKSSSHRGTNKPEGSARLVYYFDPHDESVQPVLQTRQSKGWSTGRNVALKSLRAGNVKGMTEQDLRISKCIKDYSGYYGSEYDIDEKIFVEMIGHPHIFLADSDDIPVEFVAARPAVSVAKKRGGYILETDLKKGIEKIHLEKETNTRFKVYQLTENQLHIINVINEKKLVVPEAGRAKLIELLTTLSAEGMTVYSDLLAASEKSDMSVKEVPADSRIRVQLLPFGDGLKAELYSKPFGTHPPYCKPGKGGKVLIANDKNVQKQVRRDLALETANEQLLLDDIQSLPSLSNNDGLFSFGDPRDSLNMLDLLANRQDICVVEWPEGERYRLRGSINPNQLSINISSNINWFELNGELRIDENTVLPLQQLLRLTADSKDRFVELSTGEFIALSDRLKRQLDSLRMFAAEDKKGIRLNRFASMGMADLFDELKNVNADRQWVAFRKQIEHAKCEDAAVPDGLQAELRTYQEDGFRWMARLASWNAGACLADDMGLGKTIQTMAVLLHRASLGPALVVCPLSVMGNWHVEAEKFAPSLCLKTLGTGSDNRRETLLSLNDGDVLVTSYGLLQSEEKLFTSREFATVVLDEAHVIKNCATKTSKATMKLKAGFRIALTGTPVQNHLAEIWNLFNFINPGLLGTLPHFIDTFIKPDTEQARKQLKKLIAPFILRRTKSAVLDELPPKTEIVKKIELSSDEMAFYEALRRQALENISKADDSARLQVLAEITRLRQACCNPLLIDPNINIPSSKLTAFLEIAGELLENNHRALVFSQFVSHLTIVRQTLDKQGIKYQYIDGSTSPRDRERSVKAFQNGDGELFLISLKAGGLGLNLTAADFVIHLDPWWNPAIEDQASDRAHRIGQLRPVTIYRLVTENTIEEKILQLHARKRNLAEELLAGSDMSARLTVNDMLELLREANT